MKQMLDEKELLVLECIASSKGPIGSWFLVEKLEEHHVYMSSATIGRILNRLEKLGYVEKESVKGRVITTKGLDAIQKFNAIKSINYHKNELDNLIDFNILENYMMVLEARKAIEGVTARLAAQNITHSEIEHMEEILQKQIEKVQKKESIAEDDINFHKAIAKASRNKVLESIYGILSSLGQQSNLFEYIRSKVTASYSTTHVEIFNAIKNHNEDEAEKCMINHIDNLIKDICTYWDQYYDNRHNVESEDANNE